MLELPFNLRGRRKNPNLDAVPLDLVLLSSTVGRLGDEGNRFKALWTRSMTAVLVEGGWQRKALSCGQGQEDLATVVIIKCYSE